MGGGLPVPAERREPRIVEPAPVRGEVPHASNAILPRKDEAAWRVRAGHGAGVHLDDRPAQPRAVDALRERDGRGVYSSVNTTIGGNHRDEGRGSRQFRGFRSCSSQLMTTTMVCRLDPRRIMANR